MNSIDGFRLGAIAAAIVVMAGCGDGSGIAANGTASTTNTTNTTTTTDTPHAASLSGQSYKGPTAGATICAYAIDNAAAGKKGAQVMAQAGSTASISNGCAITANDGTFSFVLPAGASGDLLVESSGGTYCSDESVYDGTSCAGGGTPIVMGAAKLRTVVGAPPSGAVANVPLTLLTTAAAANPATLNLSTFDGAYSTVATNVGLSGSTPSTAPDSGSLQTVLASLATYLGADTSLLESVVSAISGGTITRTGGNVTAPAALVCEPLAASDVSGMYTYTMMTPIMTPMVTPITMTTPMMVPVPTSIPIYSYGFSSGCVDSPDGITSQRVIYATGSMQPLLNGTPISGTYYEYRNSGQCSSPGSTTYLSTPFTMQYAGTQTLALSASADPAKSQVGTATKLTLTLQPNADLGLAQVTTRNHLFCRTAAAPLNTVNFQGFLTSVNSPLKDGSLSRVDGSRQFTSWTD